MSGFKKIENVKRKSVYVVEQILAALKTEEYEPGSRLPAERIIAKQMGVSRNSIREALSALQILGVIESRAGDGTYVRNLIPDKVKMDQVLTFAKEGEDLLDIWEARRELEITLIRLATDRATRSDIQDIADRLEDMRSAIVDRDIETYLAANKLFHLAIASGADNLPLRNAVEVLQDFTSKEIVNDVNRAYVVDAMEKSLEEHESILQAIQNRDEEMGTKVIEAHFEELEAYFRRKYLGEIHDDAQ